MPRLEIEIGAKDSGAAKTIGDTSSQLQKLQEQYDQTARSIKANTQISMQLESQLSGLKNQFQSGAISESQFRKESDALGLALSGVRSKAQQYQSQLNSLSATMKQVGSGSENLGDKTKKLNGYHQDFTKGIRGSTTVAVEFGRVLQDSPYGIQGVANNLQQLTTNLGYYVTNARAAAAASGQVLTTTQLAGGIFRSLISPISLITLAVSAITVGWTLYEKSQQKAAKASGEAKSELDQYREGLTKFIDTQDAATRATARGASESSNEMAKVNALRSVIEDETVSRRERVRAVNEIQKLYPAYFGKMTDEQILAGNVAGAYNRLTASIMATGKARAAINIQATAYEELAQIELRREKRNQSLARLQKQMAYVAADIRARGGLVPDVTDEQARNVDKLNGFLTKSNDEVDQLSVRYVQLQAAASKYTDERTKDGMREIALSQDINTLQKTINNSIKAGGSIIEDNTKKTTRAAKAVTDYASQLRNISTKSGNSADLAGLSELDTTVEKTRQQYAQLYTNISAIEKKITADKKINEDTRTNLLAAASKMRIELQNNEAQEQLQNQAEYAQKTEDIISKILADAGLDREKSREKELQQSTNRYDELVRKYRDNSEIMVAIEKARRSEQSAINEAWDVKDSSKALETVKRLNESRTQVLLRQLNDERDLKIKAAKGDADALVQIQADYLKRVEELSAMDRAQRVELAFDGSALSTQMEAINQDVAETRRQFEGAGLSVDQFREKILALEVARGQFQVMQTGIEGASDALGSFATDILTLNEDTIKNLGDNFLKVIGGMVAGLAKLAARYLINQAIGTTSMAATTAASTAAAGATAAAWSTAAALVAAATFGASAVAGGTAIAALVASTKALSLTGFSGGGYTGNMATNQIAGVVHGKEYVINAAATARHKGLLESINNGSFTGVSSAGQSAVSASTGGAGQVFIAETRIDGSDLVQVYKRASRDFARYTSN